MYLQHVQIISSDGEITDHINIADTEDAYETLAMLQLNDYSDDEVIIKYGHFVSDAT